MGYRDYSAFKGRIVEPNGLGDFTTITAALAATSSGTIYIMPGTYTENPTLKAGVNLVTLSYPVIIVGKMTYTGTGFVLLKGLTLQTNGDYALSVTGANASSVQLRDCTINCNDFTGIQFTASNTGAQIYMMDCDSQISLAGTSIFTMSSTGQLHFLNCYNYNGAASTTASTLSAGILFTRNSYFQSPISYTGTSTGLMQGTFIELTTNTQCLSVGGSIGTSCFNCIFGKVGASSAVTISTTATMALCSTFDGSGATVHAIDGAGVLIYEGLAIGSGDITTAVQTKHSFYPGNLM